MNMFFCPRCKCKIFPEVCIKNISAEYSVNVFTNSISLALCSLGNFQNIEVSGYKCTICGKVYEESDLCIKSQLSSKIDTINKFLIISIKNKKEEFIGNRISLVMPPKIIHEDELQAFKELNPYKDDKYLIIHRLDKITITLPK